MSVDIKIAVTETQYLLYSSSRNESTNEQEKLETSASRSKIL